MYSCPFCDQETAVVIYRPCFKAAKSSRSAAADSKTSWRRMPEGILSFERNVLIVGKQLSEN